MVDGGIWNPDHRYETGERVTYLAGGGNAIGGLIDGHEYYVVVLDANRFGLALDPASLTPVMLSNGVATGDRHGFERASTVTQGDVAIGGLTPGDIYYVTVVNATTIRLSDSPLTAAAALPVDLSLSPAQQANAAALTHGLALPHMESGINVVADLVASNSATVDAGIGGIPNLSDMIGGNVTPDPKLAKSVVAGAKNKFNVDKKSAVSLAASVGLVIADHDVTATVGSGAELASDANVNISATVLQAASINVQANITTEVPRNQPAKKAKAASGGSGGGAITGSITGASGGVIGGALGGATGGGTVGASGEKVCGCFGIRWGRCV